MANHKISQLTLLENVSGEELIPSAYNGKNYAIRLKDFKKNVSAADIGLDKVNNTSDLEKPLSTAVIEALSKKAESSHHHAMDDIVGLSLALDTKSDKTHKHVSADISDLGVFVENKMSEMHLTVTMERAEW